jgi:hypothetical protein
MAQNIVEKQIIKLSATASEALFKIMENPPEANEHLKTAMQRRKDRLCGKQHPASSPYCCHQDGYLTNSPPSSIQTRAAIRASSSARCCRTSSGSPPNRCR